MTGFRGLDRSKGFDEADMSSKYERRVEHGHPLDSIGVSSKPRFINSFFGARGWPRTQEWEKDRR